MTYCVVDVETTITTHMKRKASPFTDENWVVAAGWGYRGGAPVGAYYGTDKHGTDGLLATLLSPELKVLVGFNFKFDLLHLLRDKRDHDAWMAWVADGGMIWDCQLAEYLLMGQVQEAHMLSLDEVSPKYGGNVKIDEVKAYWARGVNTPDIPRQLLMDYLLGRGDVKGDIGNTEQVFLGQVAKARKRGQFNSIMLNMGSLICSTEMERNGCYVDKARGMELKAKLEQRERDLTAELQSFLPADLPFEFNWGSPAQKSGLIFGGKVKYEARVPVLTEAGEQAYSQKKVTAAFGRTGQQWLWSSAEGEPDWDAIEAENMESFERYSGGKNKGLVKTKQINVNDLSKPKSRMEPFDYVFPGFTAPQRKWLGDSGNYSTASEVIEELAATTDIPFLQVMGTLGATTKDLGTYYQRDELDKDGNVKASKGMLTLVGDDGIVHHKINHTSTVTGRLSHSDPNMGNLPHADKSEEEVALTGAASEVKSMFVSRFGPDGKIITSDFSSLEVYCQAWLTRDAQLISDLKAGLDMHCARLATAEGLGYDAVFQKAKVQKIPEWVAKRVAIKVFSFQRAYGAGAKKIAGFLKKAVELVEQWIEADNKRYPGVVKWQEAVADKVAASRVPTSRFVRHPDTHRSVQLGTGSYTTFDGKVYRFQETVSPDWLAKRGVDSNFMPTELKNYPVQGLGGEVMKSAMYLLVRAFYRYKNFDGKALLFNTVHDAAYADAHPTVATKAAALLHACMEAASDYIEYKFEVDLPLPVPSDTGMGPNMADEHHLDVPKQTLRAIRLSLRNWFMNGFTPSYERNE